MTKKISQIDLLKEYFKKHPKKDIPHPKVVDWVVFLVFVVLSPYK